MKPSVIPGYLHTISLLTPFPVGPVNAYLAEGEQLTLVDTGPRYGPTRQALRSALTHRGYRVVDLRRVLLTHAHADHSGLAAELARISGAQVWAHEASLSRLGQKRSMISETCRAARRLASYAKMMHWSGVPLPLMMKLAQMQRGMRQYVEPFAADCTLEDGDVIRLGCDDWRVLHTPGHTGGLICLHQPQRRLLISSDHLLRDISSNPVIDPPAPGETGPPRRLVQYLEQLRRVAKLDVELALPGHGAPITDPRTLIQRRLAFHQSRADRILEMLGGEPMTAHEIARLFFSDLDPINAFLAISEVIGHLQWLRARGFVAQNRRLGVARWRAATSSRP
jgi:glyoxylase-like metal-dependent hydrolase (beta-lactamase superfamily II)